MNKEEFTFFELIRLPKNLNRQLKIEFRRIKLSKILKIFGQIIVSNLKTETIEFDKKTGILSQRKRTDWKWDQNDSACRRAENFLSTNRDFSSIVAKCCSLIRWFSFFCLDFQSSKNFLKEKESRIFAILIFFGEKKYFSKNSDRRCGFLCEIVVEPKDFRSGWDCKKLKRKLKGTFWSRSAFSSNVRLGRCFPSHIFNSPNCGIGISIGTKETIGTEFFICFADRKSFLFQWEKITSKFFERQPNRSIDACFYPFCGVLIGSLRRSSFLFNEPFRAKFDFNSDNEFGTNECRNPDEYKWFLSSFSKSVLIDIFTVKTTRFFNVPKSTIIQLSTVNWKFLHYFLSNFSTLHPSRFDIDSAKERSKSFDSIRLTFSYRIFANESIPTILNRQSESKQRTNFDISTDFWSFTQNDPKCFRVHRYLRFWVSWRNTFEGFFAFNFVETLMKIS